jgi:hypothetical protein
MPATLESLARTRSFARVIGPFLVVVIGALEVRTAEMGKFVQLFFQNDLIVWIMATVLVFAGLLIIAFHQYWSRPSAVVISLLGWFVLLRGLLLLYAPQLMERAIRAAVSGDQSVLYVRLGAGVMLLAGLWLTYVGWIAKPAA